MVSDRNVLGKAETLSQHRPLSAMMEQSKGAIMFEAVSTPFGWETALMAAEKVKERLRRAVKALERRAKNVFS
jgi:hypothetical protein